MPRVLALLALLLAVSCGGREAPPAAPAAQAPPAQPTTDYPVPEWAKVAPEQIEAARKAGVPVAFENFIGMRFVLIPSGTFIMGSTEDEAEAAYVPPRQADCPRAYYIGVTEVTNGQYRTYIPAHDVDGAPGGPLTGEQQPVVGVSWDDAMAFTTWLNLREPGHRYHLPTGAEWERACRAGTSSAYWWGSEVTQSQANTANTLIGNDSVIMLVGTPRQTTVQVGSLPCNPWGLFEVHGNVWEWCEDALESSLHSEVGAVSGAGDSAARQVRGGSWHAPTGRSVASSRHACERSTRSNDIGFRLAAARPAK